MKLPLLKLLIVVNLLFVLTINAQTTIPSGNIYGTWKKSGSPYKINGNVNVPKDSLLKIEAGVKVEFQGAYMMHVYGSVQAIGTAGDSVVFTPANKTNGWQGIHVHGSLQGKDSFLIQYSRIEYANFSNLTLTSHGAILLDSVNKVRISHSLFNNNRSNTGACIRSRLTKLNINNVRFMDNEAVDLGSTAITAGGAAIMTFQGNLEGNNLEFINNTAHLPNNKLNDSLNAYSKGCLYLASTDVKISNALFKNNKAKGVSCVFVAGAVPNGVEFLNFKFENNYSASANCVSVESQSGKASLKNTEFINNRTGSSRKSYATDFSADAFTGQVILNGGKCIGSKGGRTAFSVKNANISNFLFANNDTLAIQFNKVSGSVVKNCIITNNYSGIYCESGAKVLVTNSIITNNGVKKKISNSLSGGLIMSSTSTSSAYSVFNSIVQNNISNLGMSNLMGAIGGTTIPYLKNSIVQGGKDSAKYIGGTGTITVTNYSSVINDTVAFVKPPKGIGPGFWDSTVDFHPLQTCSKTFAGLNAGLNIVSDGSTTINFNNTTDLAGNPRIRCNTIDIGPYELDGAKNDVSIFTEPTDQVICPRTSAQIPAVTCGAELSYQWQKSSNGNANTFTNIPNSNSLNYTYPASKDSMYYRLIISQNECNKKDTSRVVKISFKPGSAINITQQPKDTNICANSNFSLQAGVTGNNTYTWQKSINGTNFTNVSGGTTNPFTQKITDSAWYRLLINNTVCTNNKDTTGAAKVNKLPLPKPNLGADQTIANGGSVVLNPGSFTSYNWYKGATTPTYTADKSNLDTGKNKVWVEVTDSKGCKGRDTVIIDLRPVNGLRSITEAGIKLYPVPTNDELTIEVPKNQTYSYEIRDLQGKAIISKTRINTTATKVNLKDLPVGIYVIVIGIEGNYYSGKLIRR